MHVKYQVIQFAAYQFNKSGFVLKAFCTRGDRGRCHRGLHYAFCLKRLYQSLIVCCGYGRRKWYSGRFRMSIKGIANDLYRLQQAVDAAIGEKRQGREVPRSLRVKPGAKHPVWKTQSRRRSSSMPSL
jgi:hypothetical protein